MDHINNLYVADPKPEVMWMKNGQTIIEFNQTNYGRFRGENWIQFNTGKCRLIIQRPRESDSGVIFRNQDQRNQ